MQPVRVDDGRNGIFIKEALAGKNAAVPTFLFIADSDICLYLERDL